MFFAHRKLHHIEGTSEKYLTCFCWDNHCYFAKNSQYYHSVRCLGQTDRALVQKVRMERDVLIREVDWKPWCGEVEEGLFLTDNLNYVRETWLSEGIVPISNVKGFNQFNSITRATGNGKCVVKSEPAFFQTSSSS